jgi:hypothetical protein
MNTIFSAWIEEEQARLEILYIGKQISTPILLENEHSMVVLKFKDCLFTTEIKTLFACKISVTTQIKLLIIILKSLE